MTEPERRPEEDEPTLAVKLVMFALSCLLTAAVAEGLVRYKDGGALPQLRAFATTAAGDIGLMPDTSGRVRLKRDRVFELHTDGLGLRADPAGPAAPGGWLVVGDSQVMGQGVADGETFAARLTAAGLPTANGGVPGHGVADALSYAEGLLDRLDPAGVLVVVNQANDWEDAAAPATARYRVMGGWLVDAGDADGPRGAFLATPLSRLHLFFYGGWYLLRDPQVEPPVPAWMSDPGGQTPVTDALAAAIDDFALRHRDRVVAAAFLPVDVAVAEDRAGTSPFGRMANRVSPLPWEDTALRDRLLTGVGVPTADLLPPLSGCVDCFLPGDYHLSPKGHEIVAVTLKSSLPPLHPVLSEQSRE